MSDHSNSDDVAVGRPAPGRRPSKLTRVGRRLARSLRIGFRASGRGFVGFYHSDDVTFAASIAFYSLLSIFPFSLLVLSVLGRITVGETGATLLQLVTRAMPGRVEFLNQIQDLAPQAVQLGVVGTFLMLWASMGVFGALTSAVNHAWGVEQPPGFLKHKLTAFVMLTTAGLLMVVALLIVSAVQVSDTSWFSSAVSWMPWLATVQSLLVRNVVTPLFMVVVGLIYYYAPNAKVRLRDVWVGALLAGLLWRGAFALFSWYLGELPKFTILHGSITTVIAFLVWVYLSAVILLYGAEVSAAYARLRKQLSSDEPAAPARDE